MSFQDLELGRALPFRGGPKPNEQDPSRALVAGVFRINTAVAAYKRLVNSLGNPRDTPDLRQKLHKSRLQIGQLMKETSAELDRVRKTDKYFRQVDASKKVADAKLTKDYQSVLKDFEKAQILEAERERAFAPISNRNLQPSCTVSELEIGSLNPEQEYLLRESNSLVCAQSTQCLTDGSYIWKMG